MAEAKMLIPLPDDMDRLMKLTQRQAAEIERLRERLFDLETDPSGGDLIPLAKQRTNALRQPTIVTHPAIHTLRQIASMPRRTREQRLAASCLALLESLGEKGA